MTETAIVPESLRNGGLYRAAVYVFVPVWIVIALSGHVGDTEPFKRPSSYDGPPRKFESIVRSVSHRHGVDPDLVWAVMKAESNFNPRARSRAGARGLMQLMPGTARQHAVADIYDPAQNINGGVRHLQLLLNRFRGNIRLAVAAYNAGARTVARYKGIPPYSETRRYVRRVLSYYQLYSGHSKKSDGDSSGKFSGQDGSTTQLKRRLIASYDD